MMIDFVLYFSFAATTVFSSLFDAQSQSHSPSTRTENIGQELFFAIWISINVFRSSPLQVPFESRPDVLTLWVVDRYPAVCPVGVRRLSEQMPGLARGFINCLLDRSAEADCMTAVNIADDRDSDFESVFVVHNSNHSTDWTWTGQLNLAQELSNCIKQHKEESNCDKTNYCERQCIR